jgi:Fe-S-cluster containining protein
MAPNQSFYAQGLRFFCVRCSNCCRHESGVVFLSKKDVVVLARQMRIGYNDFIETYCRWVPTDSGNRGLSFLSLKEVLKREKEKSSYDCVFWEGGCTVYAARPLQCRAFPFWHSILASPQSWKSTAASCPGMGTGTLFTRNEIESCLRQRSLEPIITQKI